MGIDFMFDPGQQCARMSGPELADGIAGASIVICNDYEFELLKEKTGLDLAGILDVAGDAHRDARRARFIGHRP